MATSRTTRTTRAAVVGALAAVLIGASLSAAGATPPAGGSSAPPPPAYVNATGGVPPAINASAELGRVGPGSTANTDDIYITGILKTPGHRLSYLVQALTSLKTNAHVQTVILADATTGWYKVYEVPVPNAQWRWDHGRLDIHTPNLSWTGNAQHQQLVASSPFGALHLDLQAQGPVLYYGGTGAFALLGSPQIEYALPSLRTTGTFTAAGHTYPVTGTSWLDRQELHPIPLNRVRWTWMNIDLSNGDKVAIWNTLFTGPGTQGDESWATVLHPDGSQGIMAVTPVAQGARHPWTSPTSGNTYPTTWKIVIPSIRARLDVAVSAMGQESTGPLAKRYEGAATVSGTYGGRHVTGSTFVEEVGNWSTSVR